MDLGFADAATVVVGGGSGMGFATAQCLAEDGARHLAVGPTLGAARDEEADGVHSAAADADGDPRRRAVERGDQRLDRRGPLRTGAGPQQKILSTDIGKKIPSCYFPILSQRLQNPRLEMLTL